MKARYRMGIFLWGCKVSNFFGGIPVIPDIFGGTYKQ